MRLPLLLIGWAVERLAPPRFELGGLSNDELDELLEALER